MDRTNYALITRKVFMMIRNICITIVALLLLFPALVHATVETDADIQIFSAKGDKEPVDIEAIERALELAGLTVVTRIDLEKRSLQQYGEAPYPVQKIMLVMNEALNYKLIQKYPQFSALMPMNLSIWTTEDGGVNIASLSLRGMSRVTGIPQTDANLVAYASMIRHGLEQALPNGDFQPVRTAGKDGPEETSLLVDFATPFDVKGKRTERFYEEYSEDFESIIESRMESAGFTIESLENIEENLAKRYNVEGVYDFYQIYSINRNDLIHQLSERHPEAGVWIPFTLFFYKLSDEEKTHLGFSSVEGITALLHIEQEKSLDMLRQTQQMLVDMLSHRNAGPVH